MYGSGAGPGHMNGSGGMFGSPMRLGGGSGGGGDFLNGTGSGAAFGASGNASSQVIMYRGVGARRRKLDVAPIPRSEPLPPDFVQARLASMNSAGAGGSMGGSSSLYDTHGSGGSGGNVMVLNKGSGKGGVPSDQDPTWPLDVEILAHTLTTAMEKHGCDKQVRRVGCCVAVRRWLWFWLLFLAMPVPRCSRALLFALLLR